MKNGLFSVAMLAAFTFGATAVADDGEVRLIYPTDAAALELDSSSPEKRIEPPVREFSEQDVVTPLGQVRAVLTSLDDIRADLAALKTADFARFAPALAAIEQKQAEIENVVGAIRPKIDELAKLPDAVADLRATFEAAQKTTESAERTVDKLTRLAIYATFVLVVLIVVGKFGSIIVARIKKRSADVAELMKALEMAKKQLAEQKATANAEPAATDKAATA